ncbi:MAG: hypothetical protein Q9212_001280 [Teloschistes hypoglaucus]
MFSEWVHDRYDDDIDGRFDPISIKIWANFAKLVPQSEAPFTLAKTNTPPIQLCITLWSMLDDFRLTTSRSSSGAKLRVENLHYELAEEDLEVLLFPFDLSSLALTSNKDLFTRIGPINSVSIRYDRAGRSSGTAFVNYKYLPDARQAIHDFDGANAHGQPIRLTLLPNAPANDIRGRGSAAAVATRNPFDTAERPSRSLFDRIEDPRFGSGSRNRGARSRSRSPGAPRRSDVSRPAPNGMDRYVPPPGGGARSSTARSWSPRRRGGDTRGHRSRGGERRGRRENAGARPRKTQEELDREMDDYWGPTAGQRDGGVASTGFQNGVAATTAPVAVVDDGDIDMGID